MMMNRTTLCHFDKGPRPALFDPNLFVHVMQNDHIVKVFHFRAERLLWRRGVRPGDVFLIFEQRIEGDWISVATGHHQYPQGLLRVPITRCSGDCNCPRRGPLATPRKDRLKATCVECGGIMPVEYEPRPFPNATVQTIGSSLRSHPSRVVISCGRT
jgi:hypothetical protein